jgi:hypothetical protein
VQEIEGDQARALINHHVRWVEGEKPEVLNLPVSKQPLAVQPGMKP